VTMHLPGAGLGCVTGLGSVHAVAGASSTVGWVRSTTRRWTRGAATFPEP